VSLRWDQVDLQQGLLHVTRRKHGIASVHPLRGQVIDMDAIVAGLELG